MKPLAVYRALSYKKCIDKTVAPPAVTGKAFLRKESDTDGVSVFDDQASCRRLNIFGIAEITVEDVEQFVNPVDGLHLAVFYNAPNSPHHLIIDNMPFHYLHEQQAELLAGNLARKAKVCWEK
jgi:hypothetical protein